MDWDEARPKPGATVTIGEDLSGLGISELEHRITALQAEIARVLEQPAPVSEADLEGPLHTLAAEASPLPVWPEPGSRLEEAGV